jgi:hypothetical protein
MKILPNPTVFTKNPSNIGKKTKKINDDITKISKMSFGIKFGGGKFNTSNSIKELRTAF